MSVIGSRVYSLGVIMLGMVEIAYGAFSPDWLPAPAHIPGYHALVCGGSGALLLGGVAINAPRTMAIGGLGLAVFFAAVTLVVHLPHALAAPKVWVGWQAIAESMAMALGGVLAYAQAPGVSTLRATAVARIARRTFGACLLVFGVSHFVYARYTSALVPAWLPPSQLSWTYVTGVAQIAAGLAMLSGVQARLAAILLTVMYAAFGVLVHIPSVIAAPSSHDDWAENAINLILTGSAWSLAQSLRRRGPDDGCGQWRSSLMRRR